MTPLLQLDGVGKTYMLNDGLLSRLTGQERALAAVTGVDLTLHRGDVLGVVGESGCGKSTLARMILRMEAPTTGRIRFDGQNITTLSGAALVSVRKRMQMVFQDPGGSLNPRKAVRRVLDESLGLAGIGARERADAAITSLERVGLGAAQLDQYPHELSGGQRRRVAIARALAMKLGLTLIFISHDLALVHHLCSDVVVMQAGRIVKRGPPADVLHRPAHAYTKLLLEAVPRV